MATELQYVPSERQGKNLYLEGYIYQTIRTNDIGVVYWRCKENRGILKCPSRCTTKDGNIIATPSKHNHQAPSKEKVIFNCAISKAKDRRKNEKSIRFILEKYLDLRIINKQYLIIESSVRSIFEEEIYKAFIQSDLSEINAKTAQFASNFAKVRSNLYKIRHKSTRSTEEPG